MSDAGDGGVGSNYGSSFHWCFLCFQTFSAPSVVLSVGLPDERDKVNVVLFPCFPECKWKKSGPILVN